MAQRVAFLIGNQTFRPDSGLLPLQGPANDVVALARLLRDPERGRFEVQELLDKPCHEILPNLAYALSTAAPGDLFLIYYSGHGKLDRSGRLCLATADTRQGALRATSLPARHLSELVEESDCDQVVLLLDCCYSGAIEDGLRGDVSDELHVVEDARGFYIMTASTGLQAARETEAVPGGAVMGRFTSALVSGIESGAADLERKGKILLSDLRRHLGQVVTGHTPQFFARRASGDPLICLSPRTSAPLLDAGVLADLDAEQWHRRRGAVSALAGVLQEGSAAARAVARAALERRLEQERDYHVRTELRAALMSQGTDVPGISQSATPTRVAVPVPSVGEAKVQPADAAVPKVRPSDRAQKSLKTRLPSDQSSPELPPVSREELSRSPEPASQPTAPQTLPERPNLRWLDWMLLPGATLGIMIVTGYSAWVVNNENRPLFRPNSSGPERIVTTEDAVIHGERLVDAGRYAEAAQVYGAAADQGSARAQGNLGVLYVHGQGVRQSYTEAMHYFKLAADQGYAPAQNSLGTLYTHGQGVQQSDTQAAQFYKLAADQGFGPAQYSLGLSYELGLGVQRSIDTAVDWYRKAAQNGSSPAQVALQRLSKDK